MASSGMQVGSLIQGGVDTGSAAVLRAEQRRMLKLQALAKFGGLEAAADPNAGQTFNVNAPREQRQPIQGAQVQQSRDVASAEQALPPSVQPAYQAATTPQQPQFEGADQAPMDGMPAAGEAPSFMQRLGARFGGGLPQTPQTGGAYEPAPAPDGVPQMRVDQAKLDQLRGAWRQQASSVPNGGALLDTQLYELGFAPGEVRQIRGFGPLSPEVEEKIASMGDIRVRPMATGTETPDQMFGANQAQARVRSGMRGMSGQVEQYFPAEPGDTRTEFDQYGQELRQDTRSSGGRGGSGGALAKDQIITSINTEMAALADGPASPLINQRINMLYKQKDLRTAVMSMAQAGYSQKQINQAIEASPELKAIRSLNPAIALRPQNTAGEGTRGSAGGGPAPAAAQGGTEMTPPPVDMGEGPVQGGGAQEAPLSVQDLTKQLSRLSKDMQAGIKQARTNGYSWEEILAEQDVQDAIRAARGAAGKK